MRLSRRAFQTYHVTICVRRGVLVNGFELPEPAASNCECDISLLCDALLMESVTCWLGVLHIRVRIEDRDSWKHRSRTPPHFSMAVWQYVATKPQFAFVANNSHRWFKSIQPKTRMMIGVGIMAYAGAGLYLSDKAEEKFGLTPTEKDKMELREAMPRISPVEKRNL